MKKLLILAVLLVAGCGIPEFRSDKLQPYLDEFQNDTCIDISGVNSQVVDVLPGNSPTSYAYCIYSHSILQLRQDRLISPDSNRGKIMAAISHELGHCALGIKSHNEELQESGYPKSVMHPSVVSFFIIEEYWDDNKAEMLKPLIEFAKTKNKMIEGCVPITKR